jgi:hypothetical protein
LLNVHRSRAPSQFQGRIMGVVSGLHLWVH